MYLKYCVFLQVHDATKPPFIITLGKVRRGVFIDSNSNGFVAAMSLTKILPPKLRHMWFKVLQRCLYDICRDRLSH